MAKTVGLALGGGGARGWAHIGALRALQEHNINIDCVAGTSIGALVGAIYVRGELHRLEQFAEDIDVNNLLSLLDVSFPGLGLVEGHRVREFLADYLTDATLESCDIPFRCVATNFLTKREVVFESGSLVDAVRASISMPGVFVPCKYENDYFVDGGVMNPVPVNIVKAMGADVVIAVNLNHDPRPLDHASVQPVNPARVEKGSDENTESPGHQNERESDDQSHQSSQDTSPMEGLVDHYENVKAVLQDNIDDWMPDPKTGINIFDVIGNSINMMEQQVTQVRLSRDAPDILIEPDLIEYGIFDFQQAQPMIQKGYDATNEKISAIKAAID